MLVLKRGSWRVGFRGLVLTLSLCDSLASVSRFPMGTYFTKGQKHREGRTAGSMPLRTPDAHAAFVSLKQLRNNPKTKSRTGFRLGGEKGLEDVIHRRPINACACVEDRHTHTPRASIPPVLRRSDADEKAPVALHCLNRVANKIRKNLLRLAHHAGDRDFPLRLHLYIDFDGLELATKHGEHGVYDLGKQ